jgi:hypothetical protein
MRRQHRTQRIFLSDGMHARLESALVFASTIASTVN